MDPAPSLAARQFARYPRVTTPDARARAGIAQLVEHLSCKQGVTGSSPVSGFGWLSCNSSVHAGFGDVVAGWGENGALEAVSELAQTIDTLGRRIEEALSLPGGQPASSSSSNVRAKSSALAKGGGSCPAVPASAASCS
jgi:hypothetical protein